MSRPTIRKCYGINPKDGKGVGERHRWSSWGEGWGKGRCDFCGRYLEELFEKPAPKPITLEQALKGN